MNSPASLSLATWELHLRIAAPKKATSGFAIALSAMAPHAAAAIGNGATGAKMATTVHNPSRPTVLNITLFLRLLRRVHDTFQQRTFHCFVFAWRTSHKKVPTFRKCQLIPSQFSLHWLKSAIQSKGNREPSKASWCFPVYMWTCGRK